MADKNTLNEQSVKQFSKFASQWWDEMGPFSPLHRFNPVRVQFVKDTICQHFGILKPKASLNKLKILDVGCGGGLMAEPLARLGANVTGIDPAHKNILAAEEHASLMGLNITYKEGIIEDLNTPPFFDAVLALEVIEHIDNIDIFLQKCYMLLKPKGVLILSTMNRTIPSFIGGIIAAEYVLKWVPKGTHAWEKFIKPAELNHYLEKSKFKLVDLQGASFQMFKKKWELTDNISINYFATVIKA